MTKKQQVIHGSGALMPLKASEEPAKIDTSGFDEAAKLAEKDFASCKTAQDVCSWWKKWYMTAGHKRLGRFLAKKGV